MNKTGATKVNGADSQYLRTETGMHLLRLTPTGLNYMTIGLATALRPRPVCRVIVVGLGLLLATGGA
jgi:hypothetical protein